MERDDGPSRHLELEDGSVDLRLGEIHRRGSTGRLTTKELDLLCYLAERPGQVVTQDELLREVWGYSGPVVTRAVYTAIKRLRANPAAPQHLLTVHGEGYRFEPGSPKARAEPVAAPPVATNLTPEANEFVGREAELRALDELFGKLLFVSIRGVDEVSIGNVMGQGSPAK